MKRKIIIGMTIVVAAALVGMAVFLRVQYKTLMCNTLRTDANMVAGEAAFYAVASLVLGVCYAWNACIWRHKKIWKLLMVVLGIAIVGVRTYIGIQGDAMLCIKQYVKADGLQNVVITAIAFAVLSFVLGATSVFMAYHKKN